jgi:hypothetical protein
MADITKLSKNELITSIKVYYLKKGVDCENLTKFSKNKLINLMIDNDIEYVDKETLKNDILSIETNNYLKEIIYGNFIKYENISYDVIKNITTETSNDDLEKIINTYELKNENEFKTIKEFAFNLYKLYKNYCEINQIKNDCIYVTLPSIMNSFKNLIKSP